MNRASERALEEVLEALWTENERGATRREDLSRVVDVSLTEDLIDELKARALVEERGDGSLGFTGAGKERAQGIIRRHRLAER
jgi:Mn-dependent DtxR family transcriptional regulator